MLRNSEPDAIADLTVAFRAVDNRACGQLIELFSPESKRLAAGHKGERLQRSWEPTSSKARKIPLWEGVSIDGEPCLPRVEDLLAGLGNIEPLIRGVVDMKVFAANGRRDRSEVGVPGGGRTPVLEVRPALAADEMGWPASVSPAAG